MNGGTIVWFRRDLRVADNPALAHAVARGARVVPVYALDWEEEDAWKPGAAGRWWLAESLPRLSASLAARGAPLVTVTGPPDQAISALAARVGAPEVVWNRLYEPYARELDCRVSSALEGAGLSWRSFDAGLLFEPGDLLARSGRPFVQFTPFWRACLSQPEPEPPFPGLSVLEGGGRTVLGPDPLDAHLSRPVGDAARWAPGPGTEPWKPGEEGAWARLEGFVECCLARYDRARDFPDREGTSRLSPHLHFGEIGPRQVWHAVREAGERGGAAGEAAAPFLRQLGWREFAHYLLYHFPQMAERPFRPEFAEFPWQDDPAALDAWKWGATGYPLVDAAARQLLAEGWVHNRARMVSASFLTKDLLIPWQEGAAWYWDRLVDADLANNTLGWQWTAGSGPDAARYFRVFNPALQAQRYDPDGSYARRWLNAWSPGGAALAKGHPSSARRGPAETIVDHGEARARALAAFRGMREAAGR